MKNKALKVPEWKIAITVEIQTLKKNRTTDIGELPPKKHPVDCK